MGKACALNQLRMRILKLNVVNKMMEGPSLALYRQSQQTAPRCQTGNCAVLNGKGKRHSFMCQVRIEKMNANEPLLKCRENALSVKTIGGLRNGMSVADVLNHTGYTADVTKGA